MKSKLILGLFVLVFMMFVEAEMWIEKWDGTVPTVITGGNTSTFLDLSKIRK